MMKRDTSRDGLGNRLKYAALTSFEPLWAVTNRVAPLRRWVNRVIVHNAINVSRTRPHPFSTLAPYSSLDSLRDKSYFARHLPAKPQPEDLPSVDAVAALFERTGPCKLSDKSTLLFAAFAEWFTDGFLLTDAGNSLKTKSTHELDLAQLYGQTSTATAQLRLKSETRGERGRLKSQVIDGEEYAPYLFDAQGAHKAEFSAVPRPFRLPDDIDPARRASMFAFGGERSNTTPQTAMVNTLMLREHNRLCGELERNYPQWDDERVFQTARNILVVMHLRIVIEEYINHISPYHHDLLLDPKVAWRANWYRPIWFAVEFNMLYRWHSLIPDEIHWHGKKYDTQHWLLDNRPLTEAGLARGFDASSRQRAGEIQLGNTPKPLLMTEMGAIAQGRRNQLGSYNDYREAMGYPRAERFEQISSDPALVEKLRSLYGTVDRVEFYVGLFAEDPRPNAAVPSLLGRMVALDAFSQALINPLCSEHVYNEATFSEYGLEEIERTRSLADLVRRNVRNGEHVLVTMTQPKAKGKPGSTYRANGNGHAKGNGTLKS